MARFAPKQHHIRQHGTRLKRFTLPIGLRLSLAFLVIILLTAVIGLLAVQQFSAVSQTTTELNTRDLPEIVTLGQLRTLLFRQRDLEQALFTGTSPSTKPGTSTTFPPITPLPPTPLPSSSSSDGSSPDTSGDSMIALPSSAPILPVRLDSAALQRLQQLSPIEQELQTTIAAINTQMSTLLGFEPLNMPRSSTHGLQYVMTLKQGVAITDARSQQVQTLLKQNQVTQAYTLENNQQIPLLFNLVTADSNLAALEQGEAANEAAFVEQTSLRATFLVLMLTMLGVLLSIILAIIITRSLTSPIKALVQTTEELTDGNLDVEPPPARRDEIGRLTAAYDKMRLSLRSTITSLAHERKHTQSIIDASTDGVMLVNTEGIILRFNPAAERLSGWQAEQAIGQYCWDIFSCTNCSPHEAESEGQEHVCPLKQVIQRSIQGPSEEVSVQMQVRARDGQTRWLAVSSAPIAAGSPEEESQMVVGLHDITQLKAVDQLKSDFVAMVSHELRAPLTTVTGSVEMLGQIDPNTDDEAYHEVLGILDQQTKRLRQVVEEVLQLTRLDAGRLQLNLQPTSLQSFLKNVVERTNQEWAESERTVILHPDTQDSLFWADPTLLDIVFRNLFDNARKYAPVDQPVEVKVEHDEQQGLILVHVLDHGPGIPGEQLEHIFERFSRGTQSSYHWTRGYGLGLYIARELLHAHNGQIRATNYPLGACFTISLRPVIDDGRMGGWLAPGMVETSSVDWHTRERKETNL